MPPVGSPPVAEIRAAVDAERDATEELLRSLVAVPTTPGNEEPGQAVMAAALEGAGLDVGDVRMDVETLRRHPLAARIDEDVDERRNLVATWPSTPGTEGSEAGGRSLILGGHIDVVPAGPEDLWRTAPFSPTADGHGWLYGRGACDMKSGLAAMVGGVRALRRLGLRPAASLCLQSVVGEEVGGNGALMCALAGHSRADACVLVEPTSGALCTAQVGLLWFDVRLFGTASHTAERERGRSAVELVVDAIAALRTVEDELNRDAQPPFVDGRPVFVNVGVVHAGVLPSMLAPDCRLRCRISLLPGHDHSDVRRHVEAVLQAVGARPPVIEWRGFRASAYVLPDDAPLVAAAREAVRGSSGIDPRRTALHGAADARTYGQVAGTPTLLMGAHGDGMHGADERVWLPSVHEVATTLVQLVVSWCGVVPDGRPSG